MPSISVPTAIIGAAAIGGVSSAIASSSASSAQQKAAKLAQQTQLDMYGQSKDLLKPYSDEGMKAYGTLNDLLGVGGNSDTMQKTLEGLPGYQFTRDQGLKSTQSGYAARGLADSGGALKGAANYATGLANSQYGTYVGQLQNSANTGAGAASALAGNALGTGQGVAGSQIGAGNAAAAGTLGVGNAVAGTAGNIGQFYTLRNLLDSSNAAGGNTSPSDYFKSGPEFGYS